MPTWFKLETLKSKTAICIYAWLAWHLIKPFIGPYLPAEAVAIIDPGILAAGAMSLRDALTNLTQKADVTQASVIVTATKVDQIKKDGIGG